MAAECPICYDAYTGAQRRPIPCPSCDFAACARCVKTGLLTSLTDPACLSCKKPWSRAFLDEHLTRTWISGALHEHRGAVLYDRERAMLPATQAAVAVEKRKREAATALQALEPAFLPLKQVASDARSASKLAAQHYMQTYVHYKNRVPGFTEEHMKAVFAHSQALQQKYDIAKRAVRGFETANKMHELRNIVHTGAPPLPDEITETGRTPQELVEAGVYTWEQLEDMGVERPAERAKFVAACPSDDCRGFLSAQYKCGVCAGQFCSKCREPRTEAHECDPGLVATIAAIVADSRPCPSCGTAISRVSGCDQMWCTQCRTAFSYQTGQAVKGNIHNPHYFEQMAAVAAQEGDNSGCGDAAVSARLRRIMDVAQSTLQLGTTEWGEIIQLRYLYADILHNRLPEYPDPHTPPNNEDLRVQFLLSDIDEASFKQKLSRRQRERDFRLEVRAVLETAVSIFLDMFMAMPSHPDPLFTRATYQQIMAEASAKVEPLLNAPLREISGRYQLIVPYFQTTSSSNYWTIVRYNSKIHGAGR